MPELLAANTLRQLAVHRPSESSQVMTKRTTLLALLFASAFQVGTAAAPRLAAQTSPAFSPFPNGRIMHQTPSLTPLSSEEEVTFLTVLQGLPEFPDYIFSGCHDRAHALWMLLPQEFQRNVAKVWIFAPSSLTLALTGALTIPELESESPRWGYHVALAYVDPSGTMRMLDSTQPGWRVNPPTFEEWSGGITKPAGTVTTILEPRLYLFYALTENTNLTNNPINAVVNTGEFFECVGPCRTSENIESALARDEVGEILIANGGCADLRSNVRRPGTLLSLLVSGSTSQDCAPLIQRFEDRREFWRRTLWGQGS